MVRRPTARHRWIPRTFAILLLMAVAIPLLACETPVYRYAMYRWQPAPFEVYYFHSGEISEQDKALHAELLSIANDDESPLNCSLINVNLDDDPELKRVLPDVKASWLANQDKLAPGYLITNPRGAVLHAGPLDQATLTQLADSPARKTLGESLGQGHAVVFVLLTGKDPAANKLARDTLTALLKDVKDEKISLYSVPQEKTGTEGDTATEEPAAKPSHSLAMVEVDRTDATEKYLVRTLLAVESDLEEIEHPMVFPVYGRARALEPYIGKGIHRDNLVECVEFVTGACSCTVKEQNPGMDLLVRYDWETAAAQVADRFGNEEGNETQFGGEDFFPELIIAPVAPPADDVDEENGEDPATDTTTLVVASEEPVVTDDTKATVDKGKEPDLKTAVTATGALTLSVIMFVALMTFLLLTLFLVRSR